ncbi:hypothetical protein [Nocardioides limicola]|uniref:hypothetical protein n=1 Tax=Nocardioides limicola TaxID=2803368 RepID=UPI00193B5958|nr:hypothetical protein [Nocardioides sp. DJM-14]
MLSTESQILAGILLLSLVTVETGGLYLVRITTGREQVTAFQEKFARAGHAHAGVLLLLALVVQPYADAAGMDGPLGWLGRAGVAAAALLMPAGFFFASLGQGRERPSRWIVLVFVGAAVLAASLTTLGLGLLL